MSPGESSQAQVAYRKLPGDFRGFLRRYTLWLGADHILFVDSSRFSETYKRFYLRDIQTIIIRQAPRFVLPYYWVVLALAALIAILAGLAPFRDWLFGTGVAVLASVAIYLYIASMFRSCTCHLVTRVNKVELPSLFRRRAAKDFVAVMTPRILAAQGELPADWVERSTTLEELSTAADRNPDAPVDLLQPGEFSWITVIVFLLILADAGLTWGQLRSNDANSLTLPNTLNMIALAIFATIAIVRLSRRKGGRKVRGLVLTGLFVVFTVTYGAVVVQSFDQQFYHQTFKNIMLYPGIRALDVGEIVGDILVAVPGLILAFRQKQSPPLPVSFTGMGTETRGPEL